MACTNRAHRPFWVVVQRNYNMSAFNGYRRTPSDYSEIRCGVSDCPSVWRSKAPYVADLPDACRNDLNPARTFCRVCRQSLCEPCFTDHHHEGHGTPATDTR
jgi:hypothetical protein